MDRRPRWHAGSPQERVTSFLDGGRMTRWSGCAPATGVQRADPRPAGPLEGRSGARIPSSRPRERRLTGDRTSSRAASGLTCGRRRNPGSDLHGCRWLSLVVVDRIRSCDGPQTAPAVSLPPPRKARPAGRVHRRDGPQTYPARDRRGPMNTTTGDPGQPGGPPGPRPAYPPCLPVHNVMRIPRGRWPREDLRHCREQRPGCQGSLRPLARPWRPSRPGGAVTRPAAKPSAGASSARSSVPASWPRRRRRSRGSPPTSG